MANPFRYSSPVDAGDLIDRTEVLEQLLALADGAHNARLIAPRRYGKTSLLYALGEMADKAGLISVYVNFFGVVTAADIAERIELAYAKQLKGPLARWFDAIRMTLRVGAGPVPASVEVTDARAQQPLLERLALPRRVFERSGRRCLVAFDEFQDTLTASPRIDAVIRSEIEQHGDAASYVFTGSHVGMMRELFTSKRRAFYAQARAVDLDPLDAGDVAQFVQARFAATGKDVGPALAPLLSFAEGHPQRAMLLAHFVWEATPGRGKATEETWMQALEHVMSVESADELRSTWATLTRGERRAMLALATGRQPYARSTQRQVGGSRGGSMEHAIGALIDGGNLVEDRDSSTGYRIVDPLLAHWVRTGRSR